MMPANYFVQTQDGVLHGYWDSRALRISLLENGLAIVDGTDSVKFFKRVEGFVLRYEPMSREQAMKEGAE